jgi:hypothetical protein
MLWICVEKTMLMQSANASATMLMQNVNASA